MLILLKAQKFLFYKQLFYYFIFGHAARHVGSWFPSQGPYLCPLQWKSRILTTRLPEKSLISSQKQKERKKVVPQRVLPAWCPHLNLCTEVTSPIMHFATPRRPILTTQHLWDCEVSVQTWKAVEAGRLRRNHSQFSSESSSQGVIKGMTDLSFGGHSPCVWKEDSQWGVCDALTLSSLRWSPFKDILALL